MKEIDKIQTNVLLVIIEIHRVKLETKSSNYSEVSANRQSYQSMLFAVTLSISQLPANRQFHVPK